MTTVAYDGKCLAVDGRCTDGTLIVSDKFEKYLETDDAIYAFCGDPSGATEWLTKFLAGVEDEEKTTEQFIVMMVVKSSKKIFMSDNGGPFLEMQYPAAIGSGSHIALGAMLSGKTAKEAVKIAAKRDTATGGKITEIPL